MLVSPRLTPLAAAAARPLLPLRHRRRARRRGGGLGERELLPLQRHLLPLLHHELLRPGAARRLLGARAVRALQRAYRSCAEQASRCAGAQELVVQQGEEVALQREQLSLAEAAAASASAAAVAEGQQWPSCSRRQWC